MSDTPKFRTGDDVAIKREAWDDGFTFFVSAKVLEKNSVGARAAIVEMVEKALDDAQA